MKNVGRGCNPARCVELFNEVRDMAMSKKERKDLITKIQTYLRSGIIQGKNEQIIESYRWLEDLLADHGVFVLEDSLPKFPTKEPFGYFKAEPFGWTDCAESDEGAIALYE